MCALSHYETISASVSQQWRFQDQGAIKIFAGRDRVALLYALYQLKQRYYFSKKKTTLISSQKRLNSARHTCQFRLFRQGLESAVLGCWPTSDVTQFCSLNIIFSGLLTEIPESDIISIVRQKEVKQKQKNKYRWKLIPIK